jgi:dethiobiotin synthetase
MKRNRYFVAGTDTGVGKTEAACALLEALRARGQPWCFKPYESGASQRGLPSDAARLWRAAGAWQDPRTVCVHTFTAPLAPGVAAREERRTPAWKKTLSAFRALGDGPLVVEGAGGLLVPLDDRHDVIDLIAATRLPVLLVARAGLGTLNHVALSLEALQRRRLAVAAVLLVKATPGADESIATNPRWLAARHPRVRILGPVPNLSNAAARRAALIRALAPLVT